MDAWYHLRGIAQLTDLVPAQFARDVSAVEPMGVGVALRTNCGLAALIC